MVKFNTMKRTILIFALYFLWSCHGQEPQKEAASKKENEVHDQHQAGHGAEGDHAQGSANEYMHQSPVADLVKRFESPERDAYQQPEKVLAYLGNVNGMTIMDIGAGSGYFSVRLAKAGAQVIAADVNDEFQEFIERRVAQEQLQNLSTRKIPYDAPGLAEAEVDMVLIVNTYHHIEDRPHYFAKVRTGTKENGELVVIDFFDADIPVGPKHHKVSIDTVVNELKQAGYAHFEVNVSLLPYQYIIKAR